jgi:hypothetical protein
MAETGHYHCDCCGWDADTPAPQKEPIVTTDSTWLSTMLVCPKCGGEVSQPIKTPEGKREIDQVVELMEATGLDLYLHVLPEVFINWEDREVLALLPAELVQAALAYLRQEKEAPDEA